LYLDFFDKQFFARDCFYLPGAALGAYKTILLDDEFLPAIDATPGQEHLLDLQVDPFKGRVFGDDLKTKGQTVGDHALNSPTTRRMVLNLVAP